MMTLITAYVMTLITAAKETTTSNAASKINLADEE